MDILALTVALATGMGLAAVHWWTIERFERVKTAVTRPTKEAYDDTALRAALDSHRAHIEALTDAVSDLEEKDREQTLAIAEGIERVDRAERRVRAAVQRARKRLEEHGYEDPGLEAEAEQLQLLDGDGGEAEGVPAMHGDVGVHPAADMSAFPGRWD